MTSRFRLGGSPVTVTTVCHPDRDEIGLRVSSPALGKGLVVSISFPYGSDAWHDAADWNSPDAHTTRLQQPVASVLHAGSTSWTALRELDAASYKVVITGRGLAVEQTGQHRLRISPQAMVQDTQEELDLTVAFISAGGDCVRRGDARETPVAAQPGDEAEGGAAVGHSGGAGLSAGSAVAVVSAAHWRKFWSSGGAIELDGTDDPRVKELERRIVLSQYLTAINCSGSLPPQETGLVCNSWRGRFHLEMHWWQAAHFAHWNRVELLLPSLGWYSTVLETSRQTAKAQGFDGVRWPKQVGPDGRESPARSGLS